MEQFDVKVIADSENGIARLTTLQLRYPRLIHSEFMTHRVFSRNASSSRAIPVKKMLEQVRTNPARPFRFGGNKPGMQDSGSHDTLVGIPGFEEQDGGDGVRFFAPEDAWQVAAQQAADMSEAFAEAGYHKQVCNRLLEPFQFISVVVTATEWENFFLLRDHEAAEPTIHELARRMKAVMGGSTPKALTPKEWHLPYILEEEEGQPVEDLLKFSVARCARVSYLMHDGQTPDARSDLTLYDRLVGADPKHMSPTEHQAKGVPTIGMDSNFRGWTQYRKYVERGFF